MSELDQAVPRHEPTSSAWDSRGWDDRYGGEELLWSADPNERFVTEVADLVPGSAVDLACGEGRNSVWLAERGWSVTGVDFSPVALAKAARLAASRAVTVSWTECDVLSWRPPSEGFDLVAMLYLQLAPEARVAAMRIAAEAVAPGGTLVVIAHDAENLTAGAGGPQDPSVLYVAAEVAEVVEAAGLVTLTATTVRRAVAGSRRDAIDTLVRARRAGQRRSKTPRR